MKTTLLLLALGGFILAGVSAHAAAAAAPAPSASRQAAARKLYTLVAGDEVQITVTGEAELAKLARIIPAGTVTLTYIGDVRIAGLTVAQAQDAIARAYIDQRYLRRPEVIVTINTYAPRFVYFQGETNRKDAITYPVDSERPMTLVEAIQKVGTTDSARLTRVSVFRLKPDGSREELGPFNVEATMRGRGSDNIDLQPDDIVNVPIRPI